MDRESVKVCGICGDKALGYNFNAITCESCKAFFRRNALRNKEFKCPFDGNCKIDLITRRFCQRCRLKKCFDIGMKKEWILSEEEKQLKRSKIMENRKRKHTDDGLESTGAYDFNFKLYQQNSNDSQSLSPIFDQNLNTNPVMESPMNTNHSNEFEINFGFNERVMKTNREENTKTYHSYCDHLINNSYLDESQEYSVNSFSKTNITSNEIQILNIYDNRIKCEEKCKTDNNSQMYELNEIPEIVYRKAIEMEFSSISIRLVNNDLNPNNFCQLNHLESNKMNDLLNSSLVLRDPLCRITSEVTGISDALKMTDQVVRQLIQMSKRIEGFKILCQSDQIALLKGGCTEMIILRSVVSYNYDREYLTIAMDNNSAALVKLDVLKQAKGNVYEAHKRFMHSFREEWDSDLNILDLLIAITLFSTERPNIRHKEIIKAEQQSYMYLLQRYLEIKYRSKCEAKSKFLRLLTKLEELHDLNEDHIRMYLDADPKHFGPLLIEIFDLKH